MEESKNSNFISVLQNSLGGEQLQLPPMDKSNMSKLESEKTAWREGNFDFNKKPLFIGVTGGTASGKTSVCDIIKSKFNHKCCLISFDSFYKGLSPEEHDDAANYNFDSPNALDFDLAYEKINELLEYKDVNLPIYDFVSHQR